MHLVEIRQKIESSIDKIYKNDSDLFSRENYEVTISSKLAQYLHDEFPRYCVDCEYNKHLDDAKRNEELNRLVRPDIVIHKRGADDHNLVYFEIKTDHNRDDRKDDIDKITSMTKQDGEYKYRLGVFIDFNRDKNKSIVKFFVDGKEL